MRPSSVVVAGLDDYKLVLLHRVDEAVLLVDAAGPVAGEVAAEPFWLAGACAWGAAGLRDQSVDPVERFALAGPAYVVLPSVGSEGDFHSTSSCFSIAPACSWEMLSRSRSASRGDCSR